MSKSVRPPDRKSLQSRADSLQAELRSLQHALADTGNYQTTRGDGTDPKDGAEFPAQYFPDDSKADSRVATKAKLLAGGARPLGDAQLTEEDIKWYQGKEAIKERIRFDDWYSTLFDTDDINKRRLAQEIYPDYWKMREEEIDRQAAIQKKIAMLKLRGPVDLDDLKFVYALQSGEIKLRPVPLYDLDRPETGAERAKRFDKGLFNPTKGIENGKINSLSSLGRKMFGGDGSVNGKLKVAEYDTGAADINALFAPGTKNPYSA